MGLARTAAARTCLPRLSNPETVFARAHHLNPSITARVDQSLIGERPGAPIIGSMSVRCSKCGEELLGAVNRCWRCGQEFRAPTPSIDVPPIRRPPIPMELVRGEVALSGAEGNPGVPVRRGSPFAVPSVPPAGLPKAPAEYRVSSLRTLGTAPADQLARQGMAEAAAFASLILGVLSFLTLWLFTWGAIVMGVAGILAGVWGIRSRRRSLALIGLVLCGLVVLASAYSEALELNRLYGEPDFLED